MYRHLFSLLLAGLLITGCGGAADTSEDPETDIVAEEPTNVIAAELMANKARFIEAMSDLSEAQWTFQESPDRWSLAMIAEHLIKTEESSLGGLREGVLASPATDPQANPDSLDNFIATLLSDRSQRFQAPEGLVPEGMYSSPEEAIAAFSEARDAMIQLAEENADILRNHQLDHPIGATMDAHQWMLFVKAHADRHLAQAADVKTHTDYPQAESEDA